MQRRISVFLVAVCMCLSFVLMALPVAALAESMVWVNSNACETYNSRVPESIRDVIYKMEDAWTLSNGTISYPNDFAGFYVPRTNDRLIVMLTHSDANRINYLRSQSGNSSLLEFTKVTHSYNDLVYTANTLSSKNGSLPASISVELSIYDNCVYVYIPSPEYYTAAPYFYKYYGDIVIPMLSNNSLTPTPSVPSAVKDVAQTVPSSVTEYRTTAKVNIREGASSKTKRLGSLSKGTSVVVLAVEGKWYKIECGTGYGYIFAKYVKKTSSSISGSELAKKINDTRYFQNRPSLYLGAFVDGLDVLSIRVASGADVAKVANELRALLGNTNVAFNVVKSSFPSDFNYISVANLDTTIKNALAGLSSNNRDYLGVTYYGYNAQSDSYSVVMTGVTNEKAQFFQKYVSSYPYITFVGSK